MQQIADAYGIQLKTMVANGDVNLQGQQVDQCIVERNASPGQVVAYGQSDTPLNLFVIADRPAAIDAAFERFCTFENTVTQARERRIGTILPRPTLMFNGYGDQVASLYTGMDLRKYY